MEAGDTPVGKGLISCRKCSDRSQLLEVPLLEVAAVADPGVTKGADVSDATAAFASMPMGLVQFVEGQPSLKLKRDLGRNHVPTLTYVALRCSACCTAVGSSDVVAAQTWQHLLARLHSQLTQGLACINYFHHYATILLWPTLCRDSCASYNNSKNFIISLAQHVLAPLCPT